jgi:hypothetical protein
MCAVDGYMFEDINNSGDGGLYAELIQSTVPFSSFFFIHRPDADRRPFILTPFCSDRAFQKVDVSNQTNAYYAWTTLNGSVAVSNATSPVSSALPNSLVVSGSATFENEGYWGYKVRPIFPSGTFLFDPTLTFLLFCSPFQPSQPRSTQTGHTVFPSGPRPTRPPPRPSPPLSSR